jgi:hypothetical protein
MKLLLFVGALGLAAPVLAQDTTAAPPPAQPDAVAKEKRICRHEQVLGSNIPARICLTKTQWAELFKHYEEVDQGFIERRKNQFNALPSGSTGPATPR